MEKEKTALQLAGEYLLNLKFNPRLMGYKLLREAIVLATKKGGRPFLLKKDIYPALTEKYRIKTANLERNISNSIENAFLSVDIEIMESIFGNTISAKTGKPTVKELIAAAAAHIFIYGLFL